MKVYTRITIDMNTDEILDEESYEHDGPVAECKGGDGGAGAARAEEQARQARIRAGTERIGTIFDEQFNDNFFNNRQQSYIDYASPQLGDQYEQAQKELTYWLDRNGTLDSSVRAEKEGELQKLYDTNRRSVADQGLAFKTGAQNNIEDARADLVRTLTATGDDNAAVNQAINRAQVLSAPDAYSPLGDLFSKFTAGLGQQAGLERASALSGGAIKPRYETGLFGPSSNAVKVTP